MDVISECLGCSGNPDFFFVLRLYRGSGPAMQTAKSILHGCCFRCATPGAFSYPDMSRRLACLMFMEKNKLQGAAEVPDEPVVRPVDSKTAAAGGHGE